MATFVYFKIANFKRFAANLIALSFHEMHVGWITWPNVASLQLLTRYYTHITFKAGFFFWHRPPKKLKLKDKTQAKNSRKKLNLWEDFPSHVQNSRKKLKFIKKFLQNSKFSKGWLFLCHFYWQIFSKTEKFRKICNDIVKI